MVVADIGDPPPTVGLHVPVAIIGVGDIGILKLEKHTHFKHKSPTILLGLEIIFLTTTIMDKVLVLYLRFK